MKKDYKEIAMKIIKAEKIIGSSKDKNEIKKQQKIIEEISTSLDLEDMFALDEIIQNYI